VECKADPQLERKLQMLEEESSRLREDVAKYHEELLESRMKEQNLQLSKEEKERELARQADPKNFATEKRNNMKKMLKALEEGSLEVTMPEEFKGFTNIAFLGPTSVGKTSLANSLKETPVGEVSFQLFSLFPFPFSLFPFPFSLFPSFCLLPFPFVFLPFTFYLLPFAFCLLPFAFCLLPLAFSFAFSFR